MGIRAGGYFRIGVAAVVSYFSGNWWLLANQVAAEEGRRKRDSNNKRARREFNNAQKDRLEMVDIQPSAPRTLCLGRVRHVEGIRRRWSSGVHKEKATLIVSFAGHEIDGYEQWYLDDIPVTLDGSGYVLEKSLGTGAGYTTNTTGYAIGATSIGLITGTGTIIAGDTVRFVGDSTYYAVGTGITAPGTLVLTSGLLKAIAASAVVVEVVKVPYGRPTRTQVSHPNQTYTSGTLLITLAEPALAGTVIVTSSTPSGVIETSELVLSTHYTVPSSTSVSVTSLAVAEQTIIIVSYTSATSIKAVRIRPYLGTAAQNVGADMAAEYPGFITATDKFAGIACAVVDFTYDPDSFPQSFPSVAPVFRGAKCYDPRLDSTYSGGSGAHRLATPSTWTFSENPALHVQRYATWYSGLNLRTADYSMADVFSEANACDTSTVFTLTATGGGTSTVTLPRFRSGITVTSDTAPPQGLAAILETMAGDYGWAGGLFRFRAGRLGTSVFAMDTSWMVQGVDDGGEPDGESVISAVQALPREQRVNRVTGRCVDAVQRYQMLPFPDVEDAVLIAAKGERPEEIDFAGVNHIAHAQHLGSIKIRQAQAGQRLEVKCGWQALDLELFDVGTITHARSGMSAKTQEVRGWQWNPAGEPFKVKLAEITAAMFTVQSPLTGRDPAPDSTLRRPWQVAQLGALTVTSGTTALADSGSIITRTKVAWPAIVGENVRQGGEIEVQYHDASLQVPAGGDWPIWPEQGNSLFTVIPGLQAGRVYLFRARAVQKMPLVRGQWTAVVAHKVASIRAATIYRQTTAPTTGVQDGDEWFDTDDGNRYYVRAAGAWVAVPDGNKVTTFVQTTAPTASAVGDLWLDSDDGNKLYRWSGSAWVALPVGTGGIEAQAATVLLSATGTNGVAAATEANILGGATVNQLCTVAYTNNTGATVDIQIEAQVYAKTDATGTGTRYAYFQLQNNVASLESFPRESSGVIPQTANTDYRSYAAVRNVTLANGVAASYSIAALADVRSASTPATTATLTYSDSTLRVTVVKR